MRAGIVPPMMMAPVNAECEMPVPLEMVMPHMVDMSTRMMMPVPAMAAAPHFDERLVEIV